MTDFPEQIQKRLDAGRGCGSGIGLGWMNVIVELDAKIAELVPDYNISQIKEKFGGLRFYIGPLEEGPGVFDKVHQLIRDAEEVADNLCDQCGKPGQMCNPNGRGWIATRCEDHGYVKKDN